MSGLGTGKTYEVSGDNTEWEDILIKKGITTQESVLIGKGINPEEFLGKEPAQRVCELPTKEDMLEHADLDDLDDFEDEEPDDRAIQDYREKRLRELQEERKLNRFGGVYEISKNEWIPEVTDASQTCWVVVLLYVNSLVDCGVMENVLIQLAKKFMKVKFLKIRSTSAIENWPERNLPTIFVYHDGELQDQLLTLKSLGGSSMTADDFEWWLAERNIVDSDLTEDPREGREYQQKSHTNLILQATSMQSSHYYSDEDV